MKTLLLTVLLAFSMYAEEFNFSAIKKLAKDYPVTEKECQIEHESNLEKMVGHYLKYTTPSFPEDGVVRYDYTVTSKYPYDNVEFEYKIIQFMFKDSNTCNRFMYEFDAKTDRTAYNECKAKAHDEYRAIRDKYINKELEKAGLAELKHDRSESEIRQIIEISRKAEQEPSVQKAYYTYLRKMYGCGRLIKYD